MCPLTGAQLVGLCMKKVHEKFISMKYNMRNINNNFHLVKEL